MYYTVGCWYSASASVFQSISRDAKRSKANNTHADDTCNLLSVLQKIYCKKIQNSTIKYVKLVGTVLQTKKNIFF